jgi:hypothetical protein
MKQILLILFLATIAMTAYSQNLDKMSKENREATLIDTAKKIVLKYGPDYYREYKKPTIGQRFVVGNNDEYYGKENSGRALYSVIFYYDTIKEILDYKYAARVAIWEDTGKACEVFLEMVWGLDIWIILISGKRLRIKCRITKLRYFLTMIWIILKKQNL